MKLDQEQLQTILADFYAAEPDLRQYEEELKKIIQEIIELKSEIKYDENFRIQLRSQLIEKAKEMESASKNRLTRPNLFFSRFSYALVGALALAIIVLGGGWLAEKKGLISFPSQQLGFSQKTESPFKIISLGKNAFGSLNSEQPLTSSAGLGSGETTSSAPSQSVAQPAVAPGGLGGGGGVSSIAPVPPYAYYKYVYKGEPLKLQDSSVQVLRRTGFNSDASSLNNILGNFGFGAINLNSFSSLKVQSINLAEDKDFGYSLSYDIDNGFINIFQNSQKWPQPYASCQADTNCIDNQRIKISEVLPDSQIISIADDFMRSHGIDLANYGEPEVTLNEWRTAYEAQADKSQFYIPETANVLYPLKVNGNDVYDQSGNKTGMNVSVDYRQKKVSDVSSITSQVYEASDYVAETDASKILEIVENGGYYGFGSPVPMAKNIGSTGAFPQNSTKLELEVGTPTKEYVLMTNYSGNKTNYLLVPSLIFPITKTPSDTNYYYQKYIVVPLAKDLLDQQIQPPYVAQ